MALARRLRIAYRFRNSRRPGNKHPFKPKSQWIPPKANKMLEDYIEATIAEEPEERTPKPNLSMNEARIHDLNSAYGKPFFPYDHSSLSLSLSSTDSSCADSPLTPTDTDSASKCVFHPLPSLHSVIAHCAWPSLRRCLDEVVVLLICCPHIRLSCMSIPYSTRVHATHLSCKVAVGQL